MKLKYYHNPRCSKSRAGLEYLSNNSIEVDIVEYLNTPIPASEIKEIVKNIDGDVASLIRVKDEAFKEMGIDKSSLNAKTVANIISKNGKLMERPLLSNGKKVVIGRPVENFKKII